MSVFIILQGSVVHDCECASKRVWKEILKWKMRKCRITPLSHFFELMHARPSSRGRFGAEHKDAVPLYMKLGKGRHCKEELLYDAIDCVMEKTDGKGWMAVDRGLDDAKFISRGACPHEFAHHCSPSTPGDWRLKLRYWPQSGYLSRFWLLLD